MSLKNQDSAKTGPDWFAVYVTHTEPEAHIIVGKLRSFDIPAMLHQEAGATAIGITLGNLGEIKILVAPADYDRATELLFANDAQQVEAKTDRIQFIWPDGAEPQTDDEDE